MARFEGSIRLPKRTYSEQNRPRKPSFDLRILAVTRRKATSVSPFRESGGYSLRRTVAFETRISTRGSVYGAPAFSPAQYLPTAFSIGAPDFAALTASE
jgi:hypothetical protein